MALESLQYWRYPGSSSNLDLPLTMESHKAQQVETITQRRSDGQ